MTDKLKQFIKFHAALFNSRSSSPAPESKVKTEKTGVSDFPAGRQPEKDAAIPIKRTHTANMTGQVALTGTGFDLHFISGALNKISLEKKFLFDKLNSRTYFKTSKRSIIYRNESAFAFDGDPEYGLRTLQVPQRRKSSNRVYTDFIFNRATEQCIILITAEYPEFGPKESVYKSALMELQLPISKNGILIKTEDQSEITIGLEDEVDIKIPGKSFSLANDEQALILEYMDEYNFKKLASIDGLSIRTKLIRGKKLLLINPAGSYAPAPAEYYSSIKEQIGIELKISGN